MTASIISFQQTLKSDLRLPEDWTNQELAELYRVEEALRRAGLNVETDRGRSDEGEPWFLFCRPETGDLIVHFAKIDGFFVAASAMSDRVLRGSDFRHLVDQVVRTQPLVLPREGSRKDGKPTKLFLHPSVMLTAFVATALLHAEQTDMLELDGDDSVQALAKTDMSTAANRVHNSNGPAAAQAAQAASNTTRSENKGMGEGFIQHLTGQVMAAVVIALAMLELGQSDDADEDTTQIAGDVVLDSEGNLVASLSVDGSTDNSVQAQSSLPVLDVATGDAAQTELAMTEKESTSNSETKDVQTVVLAAAQKNGDLSSAVENNIVTVDLTQMVHDGEEDPLQSHELDVVDVPTVKLVSANDEDGQMDLARVDLSMDAEKLNLSDAISRLDGDAKTLVVSLLEDTSEKIDTVYSIEVDRDLMDYVWSASHDNRQPDFVVTTPDLPDTDQPATVGRPVYDDSAAFALNYFTSHATDLEMMLVGDEVIFYDKADIGQGSLAIRSWELSDGGLVSIIGLLEELETFIA